MALQATLWDPQLARRALNLLNHLLGDYHPRVFAVRLWDGSTWDPEPGQPRRFTLVLNHPGVLRMLLNPNELTLGEAFIFDLFDVEGDLERAFALAGHLRTQRRRVLDRLRLAVRLLQLPAPPPRQREGRQAARLSGKLHSSSRDRQAISYHYDISNEFYALWLDSAMQYTCGYFRSPTDDLETAQQQKLELICRKLRLKPGDRLLDIGCGWGGLLTYAVAHHAVEAVGVTISERQAEFTQKRISDHGLDGQCRVLLRDYRDLEGSEQYDKISGVGVAEQIGGANLSEYYRHAWRLLRPGGLMFNQSIAGVEGDDPKEWQAEIEFMHRYVFPDGGLVSIHQMLQAAEQVGFEVRDVESLREHYTFTLRHWVRNLEAHEEEARRLTDGVAFKIWRGYMAGSAYRFNAGLLNLYQTLLHKPVGGASTLPLTREDLFETTRPGLGF